MISERLPARTARPSKRGEIARLIDAAQSIGRLVVAEEALQQQSGLSALACKRQLGRLGARVQRLPGRPASYLIVSPEHRARGAPPAAAWLDAYFRIHGMDYYVGLLSAAALHGASAQAVQAPKC